MSKVEVILYKDTKSDTLYTRNKKDKEYLFNKDILDSVFNALVTRDQKPSFNGELSPVKVKINVPVSIGDFKYIKSNNADHVEENKIFVCFLFKVKSNIKHFKDNELLPLNCFYPSENEWNYELKGKNLDFITEFGVRKYYNGFLILSKTEAIRELDKIRKDFKDVARQADDYKCTKPAIERFRKMYDEAKISFVKCKVSLSRKGLVVKEILEEFPEYDI